MWVTAAIVWFFLLLDLLLHVPSLAPQGQTRCSWLDLSFLECILLQGWIKLNLMRMNKYSLTDSFLKAWTCNIIQMAMHIAPFHLFTIHFCIFLMLIKTHHLTTHLLCKLEPKPKPILNPCKILENKPKPDRIRQVQGKIFSSTCGQYFEQLISYLSNLLFTVGVAGLYFSGVVCHWFPQEL